MRSGYRLLRAAACFLAVAFIAAPAMASGTPKVVEIYPPAGAREVAASVTELKIVFDREMDPVILWAGEGVACPQLSGAPRWADSRTCIVPVRLEPERTYAVWINSSGTRGFRSAQGAAAEPVVISFSTSAALRAPFHALTTEEKRRVSENAWSRLESLVLSHYAHHELRQVDWTARFLAYRGKAFAARTLEEWAAVAVEMLTVTKDPRILVVCDGRSMAVADATVEADWNYDSIMRRVPFIRAINKTFTAGRTRDGYGYIHVASIEADRAGDCERFDEALREAGDGETLIVDLRALAGGEAEVAAMVAGWFTPERVRYASRVRRSARARGGWEESVEKWLEPRGRYRARKVYVLSGRSSSGYAEEFVLMFKACPGVTVIGAATSGRIGGAEPFDLPNGVRVHLPQWKTLTVAGEGIEGKGVQPDVFLRPEGHVFHREDPVFLRALEAARKAAEPKPQRPIF